MSGAVPIRQMVDVLVRRACAAAKELAAAKASKIDSALRAMARMLASEKEHLLEANLADVTAAQAVGLSAAMIDRLKLSDKTLRAMIDGCKTVAALPSPVGRRYDERVRPNGLRIWKMRVPIGVVAIVYESRPNVTVDAAAICLKSQNAVILRGGSEAFRSNVALARLFNRALEAAGLPAAAVQLVETTDRRAVDLLLRKEGEIDLVIPRGGESLIRRVVETSYIPVIKHYKGVCHVFVSRYADMEKAVPIVINAKVQRPGVCNAMETLLLDRGLSREKKKAIISALIDHNVRLFGDAAVRSLSRVVARATEDDWYAEYLDLRLAVREVDGVLGAIEHINTYGSRHTDAIVTESTREAELFRDRVDSSSVMINASTRFSDGGEYGMGCEIGISTDKLHARGPMSVEDLTTYKWIVEGNGHIRG